MNVGNLETGLLRGAEFLQCYTIPFTAPPGANLLLSTHCCNTTKYTEILGFAHIKLAKVSVEREKLRKIISLNFDFQHPKFEIHSPTYRYNIIQALLNQENNKCTCQSRVDLPVADGLRCQEEKRTAEVAGSQSGIPIFVPDCNQDGSFKQVQCHTGNIQTILI